MPDQFAAPNFSYRTIPTPPNAPRARGAFLSTPGTGSRLAQTKLIPLRRRYGSVTSVLLQRDLQDLQHKRLFSPIGSHIIDLTFFVPGTKQQAVVRRFGAVYTDVDKIESSFTYFDKNGKLLKVSSSRLQQWAVVCGRGV